MSDDHAARTEALGALAVEVSANVADGQTVVVRAHLADAALVRAIARAAYRRGAHQVEVEWNDPIVVIVSGVEALEELAEVAVKRCSGTVGCSALRSIV